MKFWWKFPIKNSDLSETLMTRGSIYEPSLICVTPSEDPSEVHFFQKRLVRKIGEKNVKTYFPQKDPKSISLDSGHLDKPLGPLISQFFQYC